VAHRRVEGEGLRTSYAFAPRVSTSITPDGPTSVCLEFASSGIYQDDQEVRVTRLAFHHVVSYAWNDFEFHRFPSNPNDVELGLIEIDDSTIVAEIRSTGRYIGKELCHFRISFDDHGTYDIVCESLVISYSSARPDTLNE
jgi:hypothetical protein